MQICTSQTSDHLIDRAYVLHIYIYIYMQEWYVRVQPANKQHEKKTHTKNQWHTKTKLIWVKNMRCIYKSVCDVIIGRSLMQPHNLGNESVQ